MPGAGAFAFPHALAVGGADTVEVAVGAVPGALVHARLPWVRGGDAPPDAGDDHRGGLGKPVLYVSERYILYLEPAARADEPVGGANLAGARVAEAGGERVDGKLEAAPPVEWVAAHLTVRRGAARLVVDHPNPRPVRVAVDPVDDAVEAEPGTVFQRELNGRPPLAAHRRVHRPGLAPRVHPECLLDSHRDQAVLGQALGVLFEEGV